MAHHRHHHHRRNPSRSGSIIWTVAGAAGGFLGTGLVASMVMPSATGILNYGVQGGIAFAGGWLLKKVNRNAAFGFMIGGLASVALQAYKDYTGGGAMSFYAAQQFPVPYATAFGSPFATPFSAAYPSAALPGAVASGASSKRLKSRFAA